MAKEARLLDRQAIHERRPFDRTSRTGRDLTIVGGIVGSPDFAHPCTQVGLQETAPLL